MVRLLSVMRCETFDQRGDINDARAAWRRSTTAVRFVDNRCTLLRHLLPPTVFAPAHHWFRYLVVMAVICGHLTQQCVRGLGGEKTDELGDHRLALTMPMSGIGL